MGKVLCYIYNNMADFEITLACQFIKYGQKHEIVPIAYTMDPVKANGGLIYQPAATVQDALQFEEVEAIFIPGGWNDEQRAELTALIKKLDGEGKLIAAICAGPQFLARAGVLDNRTYTTTKTAEYFAKAGVEDFFPRQGFVQQNLVKDGNVITAVGNAFVDFAMEIADYFGLFKDEKEKAYHTGRIKGL